MFSAYRSYPAIGRLLPARRKRTALIHRAVLRLYSLGAAANWMGYVFRPVIGESAYIVLLCAILTVCYAGTLFVLINKRGVLSLMTLFWICLGCFAIARPILFLLGAKDFTNDQFSIMGHFAWENATSVSVLNAYFTFMLIFSFVSTSDTQSSRNAWRFRPQRFPPNPIRPLKNLLYAAEMVTGPILAVYYFAQALTVLKLGYTKIYNGEVTSALGLGSFISISRLIFTLSYYAICCEEKSEKTFIRSSILYLAVNAIPLLQGSRVVFIIDLLTVLFLRYRFFGKTIPARRVLLGFVIAIPLLQSISYLRSGSGVTVHSLGQSYTDFFSELSTSFNIPAYYIQHKAALSGNAYPYILEPIVKVFQYFLHPVSYSSGQNMEMIQVRFNLGHQITYHISPGYYLAGSNVASNFIAEMSEFGYGGVLFFSILISALIRLVETKIIHRNPYFRFMSFEFCKWIMFLPRAEAFYDSYNLLKYGIGYIAIYTIGNIYCSRRLVKGGRKPD